MLYYFKYHWSVTGCCWKITVWNKYKESTVILAKSVTCKATTESRLGDDPKAYLDGITTGVQTFGEPEEGVFLKAVIQ